MHRFSNFLSRFINLKIGLIGAFFMGGIVFFINLKHGWSLATVAGSKQWIYTFFFGGVIIKLLEHTLVWSRKYKYNIILSVILISALTSCLVYLLHSFKGTPEPFYSTIPTILLAPPGFASLAWKFEKKFSNLTNNS